MLHQGHEHMHIASFMQAASLECRACPRPPGDDGTQDIQVSTGRISHCGAQMEYVFLSECVYVGISTQVSM